MKSKNKKPAQERTVMDTVILGVSFDTIISPDKMMRHQAPFDLASTERAAISGAFYALRWLSRPNTLGHRIFIFGDRSKEEEILSWMNNHNFKTLTGVGIAKTHEEQIIFSPIEMFGDKAFQLGITHFIGGDTNLASIIHTGRTLLVMNSEKPKPCPHRSTRKIVRITDWGDVQRKFLE